MSMPANFIKKTAISFHRVTARRGMSDWTHTKNSALFLYIFDLRVKLLKVYDQGNSGTIDVMSVSIIEQERQYCSTVVKNMKLTKFIIKPHAMTLRSLNPALNCVCIPIKPNYLPLPQK